MKREPKTRNGYTAFEDVLRRVLRAPHSEIKAKLEAEKKTRKRKRASRASGGSSRENAD